MIKQNYLKDWQIDETTEHVQPKYNDAFKRYDLSMKDIISAINKSKYPINGDNIMIPDGEGGWKPPDWGNGDGNNTKHYRAEMLSSNGYIIKDRDFNTILSVVLYEDNKDITDKIDEKFFKWTRVSGSSESDQKLDAEWNLRWALGAKQIPVTHEDVNKRAMFQVQYMSGTDEMLWVKAAYDTYKELYKIENKI